MITGVGIVSSIGTGQSDFFDALMSGQSGIRSLADRTDHDARPPDDASSDELIDGVWIGSPVVDFDAKQFVRPRKALKVMCREIQMAFAASQLAIQHADLGNYLPSTPDGRLKPERVAVVFGSANFLNPPAELAESVKRCLDENGNVQTGQFGDAARREVMPLWMLKYLPNMPACQVGISINAQGPNNSLVLGDVSGPAALIESQSYLQRGLADLALVGATGTRINATRMCFRHDFPIAQRGPHELANTSRPHQA
ncbi:MAG: beta-ketoacyl synthase N-terminal-like domain-containing protein, partial [Planctomycetota bacterium]